MTRTVLIDGDVIAYQAAAVNEHPVDFGNGIWLLHTVEDEAKRTADLMLANIMDATSAREIVIALSDRKNWRKEILPTYKEHRSVVRSPLCRPLMHRYLAEEYRSYTKPGLEGDDVLGILATHPTIIPGEKVIATIDKDLQTIPGLIYRWGKDTAPRRITEAQADLYHLCQSLAGDATDGYSGCPGIGMDSALKILTAEPHIVEPYEHTFKSGKRAGHTEVRWRVKDGEYSEWETICSYFSKAGLGEEEALTQARVARICRHTEYDFTAKCVKLWSPYS